MNKKSLQRAKFWRGHVPLCRTAAEDLRDRQAELKKTFSEIRVILEPADRLEILRVAYAGRITKDGAVRFSFSCFYDTIDTGEI